MHFAPLASIVCAICMLCSSCFAQHMLSSFLLIETDGEEVNVLQPFASPTLDSETGEEKCPLHSTHSILFLLEEQIPSCKISRIHYPSHGGLINALAEMKTRAFWAPVFTSFASTQGTLLNAHEIYQQGTPLLPRHELPRNDPDKLSRRLLTPQIIQAMANHRPLTTRANEYVLASLTSLVGNASRDLPLTHNENNITARTELPEGDPDKLAVLFTSLPPHHHDQLESIISHSACSSDSWYSYLSWGWGHSLCHFSLKQYYRLLDWWESYEGPNWHVFNAPTWDDFYSFFVYKVGMKVGIKWFTSYTFFMMNEREIFIYVPRSSTRPLLTTLVDTIAEETRKLAIKKGVAFLVDSTEAGENAKDFYKYGNKLATFLKLIEFKDRGLSSLNPNEQQRLTEKIRDIYNNLEGVDRRDWDSLLEFIFSNLIKLVATGSI